jgi:hypothetical protein
MSQNLNLLRQNHCRPATVAGKRIPYLFPLEKESEEGKALLAKAATSVHHLQKFSPYGLQQTYRDEATGAELPVFAVFDLDGDHKRTFEVTTDSIPAIAQTGSLPGYIPFQRTQDFVRRLNERRIKAERVMTWISLILGSLPAFAYLYSRLAAMTGTGVLAIFIVWIFGVLLAFSAGLLLLDRLCPWQKLVITAEFDGILPKRARENARAARHHFDSLYIVVDQQNRWKSTFLPDPRPRALDPLLIGELKHGRRYQFFLIDQFDLTSAEQYLCDEFAVSSA